MTKRGGLSPQVRRRFRWIWWCLVVLGGCAGALSVISGFAVRTGVGKLGAVDSMEFFVYVFGVTVYRTRVSGFGVMDQIEVLCRGWSGALAVVFTLIGALLGAAVANAVARLAAWRRPARVG
jgi:hypothetical protein